MISRWSTVSLFILVMFILSVTVLSLTNRQIPASLFAASEKSSPHDWVKEEQIKVYPDKIVLEIPNALWAGFTDTNSMDPFLDAEANAIEIKPQNHDSIQVGDVIAYTSKYGVGTIVHRVVQKGQDAEGTYYLVRGDNTTISDPFKVRYDQVEGVVVAVIY